MMMLRRLELQAFGRFEDEVIEFAPGMNLVSGPNESGKTTLLQAVVAVLFGDDDAARFVPWESSGICRAALLIETKGRQVRIERDFFTGYVSWTEADAEGVFQPVFCGCPDAENSELDPSTYRARLQELLGVSHREFLQTLLYGDPSDGNPGEASERLKACFSDPEVARFEDVLKTLQAEFLGISSDNPWGLQADGEGELQAIARRLAELEKEWFGLQETIRQRELQEADVVDEISGADGTIDSETACPVVPESSEPIVEHHEAAGPVTDVSSDPPADYATRRATLETELAKTGLPRSIPAELPELLSSCASLRQAMAEQKRSLGVRQEERRKCRPPAWKGLAFGLAGIWAAALSWLWVQLSILPIWGGLLVTAVAGAWYVRRCLQARSAGQQLDSQVAAVEAQVYELQQQLTAINDRFEALGLSPSPVETVRMQKNLPRHQQLLEQLRQMDVVQDEVAQDRGGIEPDVSVCEPIAASVEAFAAISDAQAAEPVPDEASCMQAAGDSIIADSMGTPGALDLESLLDARTRIEAEGEELRARESKLTQRRNTLVVECDLLMETLADTPATDRQALAGILGQLMSDLTGGVVDKVHVTEDFVVQLSGADGVWLPVERFSSATRTLHNLALCLTPNQLRGEGSRLPLLLDDPLGALDKKRRGQALKVLEQCAAGAQIILFSHEEALRRRAMRDGWHLISLRAKGPAVAVGKEEKNDDDGQLSFL
ncbi:MAG: ATP-binding protein [Pedobacter sp.]